MTEYILLAIIMIFIYYVLVRNKPKPKTDWETLPSFQEYQKLDKSNTDAGDLCCQYCGNQETVQRALNSEKENPQKDKFYHACTSCKVVLWRCQKSVDSSQE